MATTTRDSIYITYYRSVLQCRMEKYGSSGRMKKVIKATALGSWT
jgi:hypothetical protein